MFGHDDHDNHDKNNKPDDAGQHSDQPADDIVQSSEPTTDDNWQHPGPPPADDDDSDGLSEEKPDSDDSPAPPAGFSISQHHSSPAHDDSGGNDNDLIDLKQEALTKLSPLVGHLDQTPDEKFRTLMMMIQASDDQRLVKQAYETALKIDDEKERAQALLDIVNEINYFTQHRPGKD